MSTIIVFPGQGSQKNGMAQDFFAQFPVAKAVFTEASEALGLDLSSVCFDDDPRLHLTAYTQPAILTAEIAMYQTLVSEHGLAPSHFGGHSLGEYTALVAAGVIPLADAVRIVHDRGQRMQSAVEPGAGAMAAYIHPELDFDALVPTLEGLEADIANHNAPNQVVISGAASDVQIAIDRFRQTPVGQAAKIRMLNVSAPFHSRLMAPIEPGFRGVLEEASGQWEVSCATTVVSNTTGGFHDADAAALIDQLTQQISSTVRWVDNMNTLTAVQPSQFLEIGPGRPLRGFFRSMGTTVPLHAITNLTSARQFFEA